mmetsp:Transcript_7951/g.16152  ORF Transcript_7951/g.16152 Transcript_7951/m.16152 type:complete len:88 (+) Transcript_7951:1215-1478(+)
MISSTTWIRPSTRLLLRCKEACLFLFPFFSLAATDNLVFFFTYLECVNSLKRHYYLRLRDGESIIFDRNCGSCLLLEKKSYKEEEEK